MQMGASSGVITEDVLKRLESRGVNLKGLGAVSMIGGGLLIAPTEEAEAAKLKELLASSRGLGDTLSGYSDEALRAMREDATQQGDLREVAMYNRELEARAEAAEAPATRQAFHGSPYDFDRFDVQKINTGEGAQVYGHGLYFSDSRDVAEFYRDALSKVTSIKDPVSGGRSILLGLRALMLRRTSGSQARCMTR